MNSIYKHYKEGEKMEPVTREVCNVARGALEQRLDRAENQDDDMREEIQTLQKLSVQMSEMIKKHDERLDRHDESLRNHGQRIGGVEKYCIEKMEERLRTLESKSGQKWDKLVWLVISGGVSAVVAGAVPAIMAVIR